MEQLDQYIKELSGYFDGELGELQRFAYEKGFPVISQEAAKFLATMIAIKKPERILEIGCCIGFSAGIMAKHLGENGHITTIDRYDIMIKQARESFRRLGIEEKVTLMEGDAKDILPRLCGSFDFIFMDAAKGQYSQFLPHCIRLLAKGGMLLADDIFQNGYVARERLSVPRRQRTTHTRMREFLHAITHTKGLESCIIPIDDGMVLCTKLESTVELGR